MYRSQEDKVKKFSESAGLVESYNRGVLDLLEKDHQRKFKALFELADIEVLETDPIRLLNGRTGHGSPCWYLFKTDLGFIEIGWRARVIHIGWEQTGHKFIITEDYVTKTDFYVHAGGYEKALVYLKKLKDLIEDNKKKDEP